MLDVSEPDIPGPVLLSLLALGCGRRLLLRDVEARELAGLLSRVSSIAEAALGGWNEERRFEGPEAVDFWVISRGCWILGTGDAAASRSRNESRECPVLVGVSSTRGDSEVERPRGLRNVGSFEPLAEPGVKEDADL